MKGMKRVGQNIIWVYGMDKVISRTVWEREEDWSYWVRWNGKDIKVRRARPNDIIGIAWVTCDYHYTGRERWK